MIHAKLHLGHFLSMISSLLLLVASLAYTTNAISVPSTINIASDPTLSNLTSIPLPAQSDNPVAESDFGIWYCTNNQRWSRPDIKPDDCKGMLDFFWLETYDKDQRKSRTFRAPGGKKISKAAQEWTPRKYTFGRASLSTMFLPSEMLLRIYLTMA